MSVSGRSALHDALARQGAQFDERTAYMIPADFGDDAGEVAALREAAGLVDQSFRIKLALYSSDMAAPFATLAPGAAAPEPNRASVAFSGGGPLSGLGPFQALGMTLDEALLIFADPPRDRFVLTAGAEPPGMVMVDVTSAYCDMLVSGPAARGVLARLADIDLRAESLPDRALAQCPVAGVRCIVLRQDRPAGGDGFTVLAPREFGEFVFDALMTAGGPLGLRLVGRRALQSTGGQDT